MRNLNKTNSRERTGVLSRAWATAWLFLALLMLHGAGPFAGATNVAPSVQETSRTSGTTAPRQARNQTHLPGFVAQLRLPHAEWGEAPPRLDPVALAALIPGGAAAVGNGNQQPRHQPLDPIGVASSFDARAPPAA